MRFITSLLLLVALGSPVQADVQCDGVDDLLTSALPASAFVNASAFTITGYVKATGSTFIGGANCWSDGPWLMDVDEYIAVGRAGDTGTGAACGYVFDGSAEHHVFADVPAGWHHVAVRLASGVLSVFVNGVSVETEATGSIASLSAALRLCGGADGQSPDRITEVCTYNVALSDGEIATLGRSRLRGVGRTAPTACWALTDCGHGTSGNTVSFKDRSGNNRHVTGDHGANVAGLTCYGSEILSYE